MQFFMLSLPKDQFSFAVDKNNKNARVKLVINCYHEEFLLRLLPGAWSQWKSVLRHEKKQSVFFTGMSYVHATFYKLQWHLHSSLPLMKNFILA